MYRLQLLLIKFVQFLGDTSSTNWGTDNDTSDAQNATSQANKIVKPIDDLLDVMIVPLLILIGSAGLIYSIVLGVNYSKAENPDKREEAKKRLVNTIVGFVILLVLLVLLRLFTNNAEAISTWVKEVINNANDTNK